jgi:hypothetical protein
MSWVMTIICLCFVHDWCLHHQVRMLLWQPLRWRQEATPNEVTNCQITGRQFPLILQYFITVWKSIKKTASPFICQSVDYILENDPNSGTKLTHTKLRRQNVFLDSKARAQLVVHISVASRWHLGIRFIDLSKLTRILLEVNIIL